MDQQQFSGASTDSTKASLGEKTREFTSQAQQKAGEQVKSGVDTGRRRAAGALQGVADSLLNGSGETPDGASRYIRQAGEQVQRAADWLEHADVDEITTRTEEFARRQPAVFIGGAFALGLIAARFVKSSRRGQVADMRGSPWGGEPSELGAGFGLPDDLPPTDAGTSGRGMTGGESTAGWADTEGVRRER